MSQQRSFDGLRAALLASAVAAALSSTALVNVSYAQEESDDEAARSLEEITVTGSRIRRDDFSSPTPTTVVDAEYLHNLGIVNLGDAIVQMPANVGRNTPAANPGGNFFNGSTIANLRGLNPFFGSRTLTLVDSRRHVPTNQGDGVDLNFIPTIIIDRTEVVTGGASASYGSGAIGGVTNILLDRDYEGIKAEVDYGVTGEGDGDDQHFGFGWGTAIGERGHFVVGFEDQDSEGIDHCAQAREWCAQNFGTIVNPLTATNGLPQNVRRSGLNEAWFSNNGLFWIPNYGGRTPQLGGVVPLQFTANGTAMQNWDPGLWGDTTVNTGTAIGGSGEGIYEDGTLRSNIDRSALYFAFNYDISDKLNFFFDGSGGSVDTFSDQNALGANGFCMRPDNAFLQSNPAALALFSVTANLNCRSGVVAPAPFNGIQTRKNWDDQTETANITTTDLARYAFGFNGEFGDSSWSWDAYYQYGESDRWQTVRDNRHLQRYQQAFDSVLVGSVPTCRAVRDGVTALPGYSAAATSVLLQGCTPVDIFGTDGLTPAMKAYSFGFLRENTVVEQEIIEASASGEIADGFGDAGLIRMAAGFSLRNESIANLAAEELPSAIRTDFLIQYGDSFSGDVDVSELFVEVDVPLHEKFGLNVAGRQSSYDNTAGAGTGVQGQAFNYDINTYKLTGQWQVVEPLAIRFSQSRDVRAPNFRELYYRQFINAGGTFGLCTNGGGTQPWIAAGQIDECNLDLRGGLTLVPEEADTTTVGFVFTPQNLDLRFAVDFYKIQIADSITPASTSLVVARCRSGEAVACAQISGVTTTTPAVGGPCLATCFSDITTIVANAFNYRSYDVRGADFTADWLKELDNGRLAVRFLASRTFHQTIQTSTTNPSLTRDIAGVTGSAVGFLTDWASAANLTANLIATYSRDNYTVTGQARFVSDGVNNPDQAGPDSPDFAAPLPGRQSVNVNTVPAATLLTVAGSYNFELTGGNSLQVYGTINNLLDEEPPLIGSGVGGTQPIFFDSIGRQYRVGLRMNF